VLLRREDIRDGFSATGVNVELHEKGEGINLVKVRNESLEAQESERGGGVLEEEVASTITPFEIGGLGLRSWGDDTYLAG